MLFSFLNALNQEEEKISVCEKSLGKLREDYFNQLEEMTQNIQSKNNILAEIFNLKVFKFEIKA